MCQKVCTKSYDTSKSSEKSKLDFLKKGMLLNYQHHWYVQCINTSSPVLNIYIYIYLYVYNLYFGWSLLTNLGLCLWFGLRFTHLSAHAGCGAYLQLLGYAVNEANWLMFFFLRVWYLCPETRLMCYCGWSYSF